MEAPAVKHPFTVEEYLEREKTSLVKHEYHEGEIFAMAGGTPRHSRLAANAGRVLGNALAGKGCFEYNSDLQLATSRRKYVYADASVVCRPPTTFEENPQAVNNFVLVVEVLSPDMASYDKGAKFMRYGLIPSFQEYVLIEQAFPFVEVRTKTADGTWAIRAYETLTDTVELHAIGIRLSMQDLYSGVVFDANSAEEWFNRYQS